MTITELDTYLATHRAQFYAGTTREGITLSLYRLPLNKGDAPLAKLKAAMFLEALERLRLPEEREQKRPNE